MSLKQWLNETPGAKLIEAEEAAKRAATPTQAGTISTFDPRTEVSADAKAIMNRLTLLLFWLPLLIGVVGGALYLVAH
jgi:hypothetical protein